MIPRTYSFADVTFVFTHPLAPEGYVSSGQRGFDKITVDYSADQSALNMSADGTALISAIIDNHGMITVDVQQTSDANSFFVNLWDSLLAARAVGDVSDWAAGAISIRSLNDAVNHEAVGVAFIKPATKNYAQQGQMVSWQFLCADIQTINLS